MTWKEFVRQWRGVDLIALGIPSSTVYAWRNGTNEIEKGYQRDAIEFWLAAKLGKPKAKNPKD